MKTIRYQLTIKKGHTLRIERIPESRTDKETGYQTFQIIEEGPEDE